MWRPFLIDLLKITSTNTNHVTITVLCINKKESPPFQSQLSHHLSVFCFQLVHLLSYIFEINFLMLQSQSNCLYSSFTLPLHLKSTIILAIGKSILQTSYCSHYYQYCYCGFHLEAIKMKHSNHYNLFFYFDKLLTAS